MKKFCLGFLVCYLCIADRKTVMRHIDNCEALCLSLSRERRKFKTFQRESVMASHAIAWAAVAVSSE